jgi:hypothetical protein
VIVRYGILFPMRMLLLACGMVGFFIAIGATLFLSQSYRSYYQQRALSLFAFCWGMSASIHHSCFF